MARLRPGIWKKHPEGVDRSRREQPLEASDGICLDNPDIVQALAYEVAEHSCDCGPVNLEGQHVGMRPRVRHRDQRLASSRPNLHDQLRVPAKCRDKIQCSGRMDRCGGLQSGHLEHEAVAVELPGATLVSAHSVTASHEGDDFPPYAVVLELDSRPSHDLGQYSG